MHMSTSARGFRQLSHETYPSNPSAPTKRLVSESSAIGNCADAWKRPGSSYLHVGDNHHLDRGEVRVLVSCLQHWLDTGRLGWDAPTPGGGEPKTKHVDYTSPLPEIDAAVRFPESLVAADGRVLRVTEWMPKVAKGYVITASLEAQIEVPAQDGGP